MAEMTVGREMDAAVAEAVGLVCREIHAPELGFNVPTPCWIVKDTTKPFGWGCVRVENWHPSTSIADAFAALDAVMEKHPEWGYSLVYYACRERFDLTFEPPRPDRWIWLPGMYATRAEAICRAILALAEATT